MHTSAVIHVSKSLKLRSPVLLFKELVLNPTFVTHITCQEFSSFEICFRRMNIIIRVFLNLLFCSMLKDIT